jgi:hypothetical protein
MLYQYNTRIQHSEFRKAEPGSDIAEEGKALVYATYNNELVVRPSTGAAGEKFAGLSLTRNTPPTQAPFVGSFVVADTGSVELPRLPVAGQLLIRVGGSALTIVSNAPAAASEVQLVGKVLTFHADLKGATAEFQLKYELSASEARRMQGDAPIGGISATFQDQVGVITYAEEICTSCFDASADWQPEAEPTLGADGNLTLGGSGGVATGLIVVAAPSSENFGLTLRLKV